MTIECLKQSLLLVDNYFGKQLTTDERKARAQVYAAALKDVPDTVATAALTKALTVCRYQNQLLVDWVVEIRKLQNAGQPTANDLWRKAIAAARKIERNLYYANHGGLVTISGKVTADDFRQENRHIFETLPPAIREWAGSPTGLVEALDRSTSDLQKFVKPGFIKAISAEDYLPSALPARGNRKKSEDNMENHWIARILCAAGLVAGCACTRAIYTARIDDLAVQRDIYASRAQNWQTRAIDAEETVGQLQDEVNALINELDAHDSLTLAYAGDFSCTAYCAEEYPHICGEGHGITSSGAKIQPGVTVAADTSILPYGTVIYIEGVGLRVVQDTGSVVKGNKLDVCVNTHEEALSWSGYGSRRVWVISGGEN